MTTHRTAVAGAIVLNVPTLLAAAFLPWAAVAVTAVALAALGAALGMLAGWSLQPERHRPAELPALPQQERIAA